MISGFVTRQSKWNEHQIYNMAILIVYNAIPIPII